MEGPVWISWCCTCPFPFVPSEPAGLQRFLPLFPCSPLPQHYSSFSLMSLFSGQQILTLSCSLRAHAFKRSCSLLCSCRRTWTRNVRSLNAQVRRAFHYEELTVCFTSVLFRFDSTSLLVQITLQLCWAVVRPLSELPVSELSLAFFTAVLTCFKGTIAQLRCFC